MMVPLLAGLGMIVWWSWPRVDPIQHILEELHGRGWPTNLIELKERHPTVPEWLTAVSGLMDSGRGILTDELHNDRAGNLSGAITEDELCASIAILSPMANELTAIRRLLRKPGLWSSGGVNSSGNASWAYAGFTLLRNSRLLAATGEAEPAIEALEDAFRWADHVAENPTLIHQVIALDLRRAALATTEAIVNQQRIPAPLLTRLSTRIVALESTHGIAAGIDLEIIYHLELFRSGRVESLLSLPTNGIAQVWGKFYLLSGQANRELLDFLKLRAAMIGAMDLPLPEFPGACARIRKDWDQQSATRKFALPRRLPAYRHDFILHVAANEASLRAQSVVTEVGLAVERYRRQHRENPPAALAELVPEYLPQLPMDPFDRHPVRYRPAASGFQVYSVGLDQNDDDGVTATPTLPTTQPVGQTVDIGFTVRNRRPD